MPKSLTVNNTNFQYPSPGDEPGWGEAATGWAEEVTDVLSSLLGPDDILETSFTINNGVSTDTNITGLTFNTASARAAIVEYSIYRTSTSNPSGNSEVGIMTLIFDNNASSGNKWQLATGNIAGNAGVTFTVTDTGQVQYQSTDIGSAGYSGVIHFKARALQQ